MCFLRNERYFPGQFRGFVVDDGFAHEIDGSLEAGEKTRHQLEQRRLSSAVGTDDGEELSGFDTEGKAFDYTALGIRERKVVDNVCHLNAKDSSIPE